MPWRSRRLGLSGFFGSGAPRPELSEPKLLLLAVFSRTKVPVTGGKFCFVAGKCGSTKSIGPSERGMRSGHPGVPLVEVTGDGVKMAKNQLGDGRTLACQLTKFSALSMTGVIAVPRPNFQDGNDKHG